VLPPRARINFARADRRFLKKVTLRLVTGWLFAQMLTAGALFGQVMTQGPFIGSATASEAKVFVRTDQPANVTLRYGSDPNLDAYLESAAFATGSPNDLAEIISLSGLTPGTSYYFNVLVRRPTANRATLFFFYNC
jgi:phosphodiesterase/alkaline phosphatase D-like protein